MRLAPRELRGDDVAGGLTGVDRAGVDVEQRVRRAGTAAPVAGQAVVVAQQVHHVTGVARVEHGQRRGLAQRLGVRGDQPVGDGVERAAPQLAGA